MVVLADYLCESGSHPLGCRGVIPLGFYALRLEVGLEELQGN